MPPRLRQPGLQSPSRSIIQRPSCQCLCEPRARQFSSTPCNATRQRAEMFRWLNGPGNVFRQPLPGSTNYLNAYDRSGNLLRVDNAKVAQGRKSGNEKKDKDDGEDTEIDLETSSVKTKNAQRPSPEARMRGAPLPKETREDLMPFPMNREFRSQSVLSEQLKDAIYRKVIEQGKSVRDVSATLGVEMRRVAAVVRLKAVEKEWEEQVCSPFFFFYRCCRYWRKRMRKQFRLVLKTSTMVTKKKLQLSDTDWLLPPLWFITFSCIESDFHLLGQTPCNTLL